MRTLQLTKATLVILLCFFISSCSKDDDEDGIENISDLYGVWEPIHSEGWITADGDKETWNNAIDATTPDEDADYPRVEFLANNTYKTYYYWEDESIWEQDESGTYSIKGKTIYTKNSDYESAMTVKSLNANELKLEVYEEWNEEGVHYAGYQVMTYKKIK